MRPIPLNVQTLYADLLDTLTIPDVQPASISRRKRRGKTWLYATVRSGRERKQISLGDAEDPNVLAKADAHREAEQRAKARRTTVTALKRARIPAPTLQIGRILECFSSERLFEKGITLVGTHAFRLYPCVLGFFLPGAVLATNDVDISAASFASGGEEHDLEEVIRRAEPNVRPVWREGDVKPSKFQIGQLSVDVITKQKRGGKSPVVVDGLGAAGEALAFQDYLTDQTIEVAALYGSGVLVRVPEPARFAVHKLIIAARRPTGSAKIQKDLRQAENIIDVLLDADPGAIEDALDDGRSRGRKWKTAINASLRLINRDVRQGRLPFKTS